MNTLGATLAPIFGIMIVDYYKIRNEELNVDDLYNMEGGDYHYGNGWNDKAPIAFAVASVFSVATVWVPALGFLSGYAWIIGAILGGVVYLAVTKK